MASFQNRRFNYFPDAFYTRSIPIAPLATRHVYRRHSKTHLLGPRPQP